MVSPIVDQFESIINNLNLKDFGKKDSLLREFLQSKIIEKIYQNKISKKLFFIGGTSLRLLRGLDRFSEDLDFDYEDINKSQLVDLYNFIIESLRRENIEVIEYKNIDKDPVQFEIRFPKILYELKLRPYPEENLVIKLDFDNFWKGHKSEVLIFDKFGFLTKVVTVSKNEILTQKLFALINRKETMARDLYDTVWLLSQSARIDWSFLKKNKLNNEFFTNVRRKINKEKTRLSFFKRQLIPFLVHPSLADKIDFIDSYFLSKDEIKFEKFDSKKSLDFDDYVLNFYFKGRGKEVKFTYLVSETAMANPNIGKIEKVVYKILRFYEKNPFKDYTTKKITTANLVNVFDFEEILQ